MGGARRTEPDPSRRRSLPVTQPAPPPHSCPASSAVFRTSVRAPLVCLSCPADRFVCLEPAVRASLVGPRLDLGVYRPAHKPGGVVPVRSCVCHLSEFASVWSLYTETSAKNFLS